MTPQLNTSKISRHLVELANAGIPNDRDLWPSIENRLQISVNSNASRTHFPSTTRSRDYSLQANDPHAVSTLHPEQRSSKRQWVELGIGSLAVVVVGLLLVVVFRDWNSSKQDQLANVPATHRETSERLYVASHVFGKEGGGSVDVHGRVTAFDAADGRELFQIDTGSQVEFAVSRDGRRLFIAALNPATNTDEIVAVEAYSGKILWRTPLDNRLHWILGLGPSSITASADGSRVYVQRSDPAQAHAYWITELDGTTGVALRTIDTDNCRSGSYVSPDGRTLYVLCDGFRHVRAIDLETNSPIVIDLPLANIIGAAVSPTTDDLYIVTANEAIVVGMNSRSIVERADLAFDVMPARLLRLVGISPDASHLFVGLATDIDQSSAAESSAAIVVIDTDTWKEVKQINSSTAVTGQTLAAAPDNHSVFASSVTFREGTSIPIRTEILRLGSNSTEAVFASREREEALNLVTSHVDMPLDHIQPSR